jgi:hypothetical protein
MSDHFLRDETGRCHTILSVANVYTYEGFTFEFHDYLGPNKLKKDGGYAAREGKKFHATIHRWYLLTAEERRATQIAG